MSPEISGNQDDRSTVPVGGNDLTPLKDTVKTGPLTPGDIEGLTPDQLDEEIRDAINRFNIKFQDFDPEKVRQALHEADPNLTREELLTDFDGLETKVTDRLETTGTIEIPEVRKARLGQFVENNFKEICPPECRDLAIEECLGFENDCRNLFGEPDLELGEEDANDPDLKERISTKVLAKAETVVANDETIATRIANRETEFGTEGGIDKRIPTAETRRADLEVKNPTIPKDETGRLAMLKTQTNRTENLRDQKATEIKGRAKDQAKNNEIREDLTTVKELQANFNQLRANKGTIGALKTLLEPGKIESPEMKAIIQGVLITATALTSAIPGKSEVVTRILDQSNINLGAGSPIQIFAGFLDEADKSDELTKSEKAQIRKVLHKQIDIKSGSDMKKALDQGRGVKTVTNEDGNTHTEIIPYDRDNMAEIQPGQYLYTDKQGKSILRVEIDNGKNYEFILPENSEADMGKVGIIGQVMDAMSDYNMANPIYQRGITLQAGGRIELDFPKDWVTTQNVLKIFFDKTTGWDNGLLSANDTMMMKHLMQGNAAKGDATRADADDATATRDFTKQGILDKNGEVDWARFKEVVDHNREQLGHGQIEFESGVEDSHA